MALKLATGPVSPAEMDLFSRSREGYLPLKHDVGCEKYDLFIWFIDMGLH